MKKISFLILAFIFSGSLYSQQLPQLTQFMDNNYVLNPAFAGMQDYYQDHDLFVLPATAEPASISVLESVGLGTPSICSDTNGTKFYLLENNFGLTFKDNNEDDLLDKIKLILTNEKLKFFEEEIAVKNEAVLGKENFYKAFMAL